MKKNFAIRSNERQARDILTLLYLPVTQHELDDSDDDDDDDDDNNGDNDDNNKNDDDFN